MTIFPSLVYTSVFFFFTVPVTACVSLWIMRSITKAEPLGSAVSMERSQAGHVHLSCGVLCLLAEWGLLHEHRDALRMAKV